tara:strand:+ start:3163 stop:4023 length:861 start_codon:yes stop_codon:yes gene_type:complete
MALRLELHYPRVALSKNTVHLALAEAVYQKMAAAGIWTDADSKNRILADTLAALELVSIGLTKVIADANTVEDTLVHRVTKGLFDTVAQAETFKFELAQTVTEQATAHEEFQFDLNHYESDTVATQDMPRLSVEKWFADSVSTEDTTVVAKIFFLDFIETLLADDASGFSMLLNRGRDEDATNTADLSNWSIGKFASDVITEVRDSSIFELSSAKTDNAVSNDLAYTQAAFSRFFSDTVSLTETVRVDEPQYFGESLGLQDSATIVHIRVATAILNNMQLNQGTLG